MEFSDKVKQTRKQLGLSQEELAQRLELSFATINRWESGNYKPSRLAKKAFEAFCQENNVNFEEEINE